MNIQEPLNKAPRKTNKTRAKKTDLMKDEDKKFKINQDDINEFLNRYVAEQEHEQQTKEQTKKPIKDKTKKEKIKKDDANDNINEENNKSTSDLLSSVSVKQKNEISDESRLRQEQQRPILKKFINEILILISDKNEYINKIINKILINEKLRIKLIYTTHDFLKIHFTDGRNSIKLYLFKNIFLLFVKQMYIYINLNLEQYEIIKNYFKDLMLTDDKKDKTKIKNKIAICQKCNKEDDNIKSYKFCDSCNDA